MRPRCRLPGVKPWTKLWYSSGSAQKFGPYVWRTLPQKADAGVVWYQLNGRWVWAPTLGKVAYYQ